MQLSFSRQWTLCRSIKTLSGQLSLKSQPILLTHFSTYTNELLEPKRVVEEQQQKNEIEKQLTRQTQPQQGSPLSSSNLQTQLPPINAIAAKSWARHLKKPSPSPSKQRGYIKGTNSANAAVGSNQDPPVVHEAEPVAMMKSPNQRAESKKLDSILDLKERFDSDNSEEAEEEELTLEELYEQSRMVVNRVAEGSYYIPLTSIPSDLSANLLRVAKGLPKKLVKEDVNTLRDYFILRNKLRNSAVELKKEKADILKLQARLDRKKRYSVLVPPQEEWEIIEDEEFDIGNGSDEGLTAQPSTEVMEQDSQLSSSSAAAVTTTTTTTDNSSVIIDTLEKTDEDPPVPVSDKFKHLFTDNKRLKVRAEEILLKSPPSPLRFDPRVTLAHAIFQVPFDFAPIDRILHELKNRLGYNFEPKTVLDYGSVAAVASWAMKKHFNSVKESYFVHHSQAVVDLADDLTLNDNKKKIFPELRLRRFLPTTTSSLYDFVVIMNSFAELQSNQKLQLVEQLWERTALNGCLIFVEHGDRLGFRDIMAAREHILELARKEAKSANMEIQAHVVAPCQHDDVCPLIKSLSLESCSFKQKISLPQFREFSSTFGRAGYVSSTFSYVVIMKTPRPRTKDNVLKDWGRLVLGNPQHLPLHIAANVCTSEGEITRHSNLSPQLGKELYRDMKLRYEGDLIPINDYLKAIQDSKKN